jgi:hypothetical protein
MLRRATAILLALLLLLGAVPMARAQAPEPDPSDTLGLTPPRLAYGAGAVSFWRPGAEDWAPAQVNTPLAPGDELATDHDGSLEVQIGARAFARAWGDTQLGLVTQDPDHLQLKITAGHLALDVREAEPGHAVEISTPHAAFTLDTTGYYRVDVTPERTSFVSRRGGRASVTTAGGQPAALAPDTAVVVQGEPATVVLAGGAPLPDAFDHWSDARTDLALTTASARYVPAEVYGADDLDRNGTWSEVPTYGAVWVPRAVPAGWAPYSTGRWIYDPYYGWTWVDTAAWGWAPYHYGRWVFVNNVWAWVPGPIVRRVAYAPALVVFLDGPGARAGAPCVSWVALGWGEPLVPWWGRAGFVGRPWWGGWGGPRRADHDYRNLRVRDAVVAVRKDGFGRRPVHDGRVRDVDTRHLTPVHGRLNVKPTPASFVPGGGAAPVRPPDATRLRPVVETRKPSPRPTSDSHGARVPLPQSAPAPAPRPVVKPREERREPQRLPDVRREPSPAAHRDAQPPARVEKRPTPLPAAHLPPPAPAVHTPPSTPTVRVSPPAPAVRVPQPVPAVHTPPPAPAVQTSRPAPPVHAPHPAPATTKRETPIPQRGAFAPDTRETRPR